VFGSDNDDSKDNNMDITYNFPIYTSELGNKQRLSSLSYVESNITLYGTFLYIPCLSLFYINI
jgi:hypothetical protein